MNPNIKALYQAVGNTHLKKSIQTHVKEIKLKSVKNKNHLVIYLDNIGPLHEMDSGEMEEHLQKGLEKLYEDPKLTYELKLYKKNAIHEREKKVPHVIR